jgi:peptidyl-prolyl cis-trans isomerase C
MYILVFTCAIILSFAGKLDGADIDVVVSIGNETITKEEFKETIQQLRKAGNTQQVLEAMTPEGRRRLLDRLIEQKLFALEAKRQGLPEDPVIQMAIQAVVEKVLARYFLQKRIFALDLKDDQLQRYYRENRDNFRTENRVKARHIITRTKREAEEVLNTIRAGADFSRTAAQTNIDRSKANGGDLGWVKRGVMVKPFEDVLFSLKPDQVSGIVETSFGYHIIKVEKIDPGRVRPFETVKDDVRRQMIDQQIFRLKNELIKKYPVRINDKSLNDITM